MVAKEFCLLGQSLEAGNDEESTLLQDPHQYSESESESEAEEALSLCDLPLYSNSSSISARWGGNNFSKEYEKNSQSNNNKKEDDDDDDDDFFEFFSEEFTTSTTHSTASENIIFCGKLIPFKDPPQIGNNNNSDESNVQKGTLLPWGSNSRFTSKAVTCNKGKGAKGNLTSCEYSSIGKASLLRSPTKSRWFLFMFGTTRLPTNTGMELRDIRSRQSRSRRRMFAAAAPEHEEGEVMQRTKEGRRECKGLWRVLRSISVSLGCRSSKLANDAVKAAFV